MMIVSKAELQQVGIFFALNFLPWDFLLIKKLEIEKTKTTQYTTFKTDIIKVGSVFSISNPFINKTYQANNWSAKKNTFLSAFGFTVVISYLF